MSIWRRQGSGRTDPDLPLSHIKAERLRALVQAAFTAAGHPVRTAADHVVDDQGSRYGLWNLAALVSVHAEHEWPDLVEGHVRVLLTPGTGLADLDPSAMAAAVRLRLFAEADLPAEWHPTAPRVTDDLVSVLSLDLADQVLTPSEAELAKYADLGALRQQAHANLRRQAAQMPLHLERTRPGGVHVAVGESSFVASLALVLDDLLERAGTPDAGHGAFVVVPYRHQVAWRVVDGPDAVRALHPLLELAQHLHAQAPGQVSPDVHWVRGGRWRRLSRVDGEHAEVTVGEDLAAVLDL